MNNMTHLHVHSNYSLLQGAASIEGLLAKAANLNMSALALTDTNGMYGLIPFAKKAAELNIQPILGTFISEPSDDTMYAIFLAKNIQGYSDICNIITMRKLRKDFSLIKLLKNYFKDLFIITPSFKLLDSIPLNNNIFAELVITKDYKFRNKLLYDFALLKDIRYIPTNPVYFLNSDDFILHKTLTAIRKINSIDNIDKKDLADEEFFFKSPYKLFDLWRRIPGAIANINYIIENCKVDLQLGKYKFPDYKTPGEEDSRSYLSQLVYGGLSKRYSKITPQIRDRLNYELDTIYQLGLTDYFLVVWDIVREAKRRGMMLIGRGSAANSIVSYCLEFTEVDPIKYDLYFERFLNKSRSSPPDIDLDFSWKERDDIVRYVFNKYGHDKVAMISTHVTFRARSAIREVAKVFNVPEHEISRISKFIPWTGAQNLPNLSELYPETKSLKLEFEPWSQIIPIAARLADFPRHVSIHAGGIVISPQLITKYTALEYASNKGIGLIITQPDMHGIEDIGLVKIDLLSQRSLGVLRDTLNQIEINNSA